MTFNIQIIFYPMRHAKAGVLIVFPVTTPRKKLKGHTYALFDFQVKKNHLSKKIN